MMLVTHLVDNVVEDDKYDNGNRYHNDRLHPDLEVLRLLAVDLRLEAALLVADMQPMFLNVLLQCAYAGTWRRFTQASKHPSNSLR